MNRRERREIIAACLGCFGLIIAALIGLALPFVERIANSTPESPAIPTIFQESETTAIVLTESPQQTIVESTDVIHTSASSLCPDTVARSAVSTWGIGAADKSSIQSYLDDYESYHKTGSGFVKGDNIPAGVIVATDFGNGESEAWQTHPVKPIVHYRSWGLFEVIRSFSAPSAGSCVTIIP